MLAGGPRRRQQSAAGRGRAPATPARPEGQGLAIGPRQPLAKGGGNPHLEVPLPLVRRQHLELAQRGLPKGEHLREPPERDGAACLLDVGHDGPRALVLEVRGGLQAGPPIAMGPPVATVLPVAMGPPVAMGAGL